MPTLITDPASITANAYCTVAEADTYHLGRLYNAEWTGAAQSTKETAIIMATTQIDKLPWAGAVATIPQALRWPRVGMRDFDRRIIGSAVIPPQLKNAVAELAWLLIKEDTIIESSMQQGLAKITVGPIELDINRDDRKPPISRSVIQMVTCFLQPAGVRLTRA